MRRPAAILALLLALAACDAGSPIAATDLELRVEVEAGATELGRAFPVTVVRTYRKDLEPETWSDDLLAPLDLRVEEVTRREDDLRVEETRRCRAYAFSLGNLEVPGPSFRARPRGGGPLRVVRASPLRLRVTGALDPDAPIGEPELPGDLLTPSSLRLLWTLLAAAASVGAAVYLIRIRRRLTDAPEPVEAPVVPAHREEGPHVRALRRIEKLRARNPGKREAREGLYAEASGLVRDYLRERLGLRAAEMTSEEVLRAPEIARSVPAPACRRLSGVLGHCDLVKFARHDPTAEEWTGMLSLAERFVRETAEGGPG